MRIWVIRGGLWCLWEHWFDPKFIGKLKIEKMILALDSFLWLLHPFGMPKQLSG